MIPPRPSTFAAGPAFGVVSTVLLLAGAALAVAGLQHAGWAASLPWQDGDGRGFAWLLVAVFLVAWLAQRASGLGPAPLLLASAVLLAALSGQPGALLVAAWLGFSAWTLGLALCRHLRLQDATVGPLLPLLAGAAALATAIGVLAHWPVNVPALHVLLELAGPAWWLRQGGRPRLPAFRCHRSGLAERVMVALALVHLMLALLPEFGYDALALHLFVAAHLRLRQAWGFDPGLYSVSLMPMLADWMFAAAYMLGGEPAARLCNAGFLAVMCALLLRLARALGCTRTGTQVAVILFLATPLVVAVSSTLQVELVWGSYVLAACMVTLSLLRSRPALEGRHWRTLGLLAGAATAAKAVTLPVLVALALPLLPALWRAVAGRGRLALAGALLLFALPGCVPYLTAWLIAGNPVFPFFNGVFRSPWYPPVNFDNGLYNSGASWDLPWRVVFDATHYGEYTTGAGGFGWLLLLPATLAVLACRRDRRGVVLGVVLVLSVMLVFRSQSYLRYVFPFFAAGPALFAATLCARNADWRPPRLAAGAALAACVLLDLAYFTSATWSYRSPPLVLLGNPERRGEVLRNRVPVRLAVAAINALDEPGLPVPFLTNDLLTAGLAADALYPNWYNPAFADQVARVHSAAEAGALLRTRHVHYLVLDDSWQDAAQRAPFAAASTEVARFGRVSVREVSAAWRFGPELVKSPDFGLPADWSGHAAAPPQPGMVRVTATAALAQVVPVEAGLTYRNEVVGRCDGVPAEGRMQVNWLDRQGNMLGTSIGIWPCSPEWSSHVQFIQAPPGAIRAQVYASGHGVLPVQVGRVSLR